MTTPEPVLELRDLSLRYGPVQALRGLNLELRPGEILGLLGPNGAGKTSAIECLLGLRVPDTGDIRLLGEPLRPGSPGQRANVGAQLQDSALQDRLTPREALRLFGAFQPTPPDERALLGRFGLTDKANAAFSTLSEGQKRRLLLALAFLNAPRVLVLDEPSAGLDPHARGELHQLIQGLRAEGRSVLLSTHYLEEAEQLCDRVALLDAGKLVALDTPAALIAKAKALPRLRFRCLHAIASTVLSEALDGAVTLAQDQFWELSTREPNTAITKLTRHLETVHNPLLEIQILRPSLADVFLELTGNAYATEDAPAPRA